MTVDNSFQSSSISCAFFELDPFKAAGRMVKCASDGEESKSGEAKFCGEAKAGAEVKAKFKAGGEAEASGLPGKWSGSSKVGFVSSRLLELFHMTNCISK